MSQKTDDYILATLQITIQNKVKQQLWRSKALRDFDPWFSMDQGQAAHFTSLALMGGNSNTM